MSRDLDDTHVHLTSTLIQKGVALPAWLAVALGACAVLATLSFLWCVIQLENRAIEIRAEIVQLKKEIRVLQLHSEDVESVLIRQGFARREDFATWDSDSGPGRRAPKKER